MNRLAVSDFKLVELPAEDHGERHNWLLSQYLLNFIHRAVEVGGDEGLRREAREARASRERFRQAETEPPQKASVGRGFRCKAEGEGLTLHNRAENTGDSGNPGFCPQACAGLFRRGEAGSQVFGKSKINLASAAPAR